MKVSRAGRSAIKTRRLVPPARLHGNISNGKMSNGELALWAQLRRHPGWLREFRFVPNRKWRFYFACPSLRLAVEVDGGAAWQGHGQVSARERNYEKANEATARGWRVLRGSTAQAEDGRLLEYVERCLGAG